ncbi:MAG TPA: penicillin-binding protein, partial [Spirochaetia bacterium]|nr:penicillin-binding protein [Spirochaetia bacterium]
HGRWSVGGFDDRSMAGKTGTTQNWSDAWAIGFTPQMTTAIWFGFDTPGNSLGLELTGSTAAGPVWAKFMKKIHEGLPKMDFPKPLDGIVKVTICEESGLLPDPQGNCDGYKAEEVFIKGTEPTQFCQIHKKKLIVKNEIVENLRRTLVGLDLNVEDSSLDTAEDFITIDSLNIEEDVSDLKNPLLE